MDKIEFIISEIKIDWIPKLVWEGMGVKLYSWPYVPEGKIWILPPKPELNRADPGGEE